MSEKINFFTNKNNLTFKDKFFYFMNLLVSNPNNSRLESILFLSIFYIQILSIFFSETLGVLNKEDTMDEILIYIYNIIRGGEFYVNKKSKNYKIMVFFLLIYLILLFIYSLLLLINIKRDTVYSFNFILVNFLYKFTVYILYNIVVDVFIVNLCFYKIEKNEFIVDYDCSINDHILIFFVSLFILIMFFINCNILQIFNSDSFYLSTSVYAQISSNYWFYMLINNILISLWLRILHKLRKEIFFLINFIISVFLFLFYFKHVIYYDKINNILCGAFHMLYIWASIFFLIFNYINIYNKGVIYIIGSLIILFIFINIRKKFINKLFIEIPFYKIKNKSYLLFYLRGIIDLINDNNDPKNITLLDGIIRMHYLECPGEKCPIKTGEKLYLPLTNEWTDRTKSHIIDKVFLYNLIIIIMKYFLSENFYNAEIMINYSFYYLKIIGNISQSIYVLEKIKTMKLNLFEKFSYERLKLIISEQLIEKLTLPNEKCSFLENLNPSYYYQYQFFKEKFYNEINKDLELIEKFWMFFSNIENKNPLNFNEIFKIVFDIKKTKKRIEKLWLKLYNLYSGINEVFDFYIIYVEQINDDSFMKKKLEEIKRKKENFGDNVVLDYYNLLFKSDTGLVICNGDKGREGIIEKVNDEFNNIFKYKDNELIGKNINILMPKIFMINHNNYIKNYLEIGEKKFINNNEYLTYAKDKENCIICIKISVKIFPVLCENIFFIGLLYPEKYDDIIFIDNSFIIQGMSKKLIERLKINNLSLFNDNEIPFYAICKNFINFYNTFMKGEKDIEKENKNDLNININFEELESNNIKKKKKLNEENIEINENIELEYIIQIAPFIIKYDDMTLRSNKNISNINESLTPSEYNNVDEHDKLLSTTPTPKFIKTPKTPKNNNNNFNMNNGYTSMSDFLKNNKIKKQEIDYEKYFKEKIKLYKNYFIDEKFNELEEEFDKETKSEETIKYKFNFTFKKYFFSIDFAYLIRCIENKNNTEIDDSEDEKSDNKNYKIIFKSLNNKFRDFKQNFELNQEEFDKFSYNNENYMSILEDENNEDIIRYYNQLVGEIKGHSRILGKKAYILEDENLSQSSQSAYNSFLSKINKIFETREKIIRHHKTNFRLNLKIILFPCFYLFISFIIIIYFYNQYTIFHTNLRELDYFQSSFYLTGIRLNEIVACIITMKMFKIFQENGKLDQFKIYSKTHEEFYKDFQNYTMFFYNNTYDIIGGLEKNISKFFQNTMNYSWQKLTMNHYYDLTFFEYEFYPFYLHLVFIDSKELVYKPYFQYELITNLTEDEKELRDYLLFDIIENSYDILIPYTFQLLPNISKSFYEIKDDCIKNNYITFFLYLGMSVCLLLVYFYILIKISKDMGISFEKLSKISQDKIYDILKSIRIFQKNFQTGTLLEKNIDDYTEIFKENKEEIKNITHKNTNTLKETRNDNNNINNTNSYFSFEAKEIIKLKLNKAYFFHIIIILIFQIIYIFLLILTINSLINHNENFLNIQKYFLGRYLYSSGSLVYIFCEMAQCKVDTVLKYDYVYDPSLSNVLYKNLPYYKPIKEYYENNFLMDACTAVNKVKGSVDYEQCYNDETVKIINNTISFFGLVDRQIENLEFELKTNLKNNPNYDYSDLFNKESFQLVEKSFYQFIMPTIKNIIRVIQESIDLIMNEKKNIIIFLISIFTLLLFLFMIYIQFIFVKKIDFLISVSNYVIKIIPVFLISTNQDLENWLDSLNK